MRVLADTRAVHRSLRWVQRFLLSASALALGYSAYVLAETWLFQQGSYKILELQANAASPGPNANSPKIRLNSLLGRIEIPRLNLSAAIAEGTGAATLRHAVGHIAGTALPGQPGNIGLAGHRDTFFRSLKDIRQDDEITLKTTEGQFRYRVMSTRIVDPTEVGVLDASSDPVLTLITCYPFYFIGPAPARFIVRASRDRLE